MHASFVKEVVNISVLTLLCHSGLAYVYSNAMRFCIVFINLNLGNFEFLGLRAWESLLRDMPN